MQDGWYVDMNFFSMNFCPIVISYVLNNPHASTCLVGTKWLTHLLTCIVTFCILYPTSVACDVGPSVNTLKGQLIFPSKPNFCNLFEFLANKIHSKINIFHIFSCENCKRTPLNLTRQVLSNNTKSTSEFQYNFQFWFYLVFIEKMVQ
jgi:hypothetical protein